MGPEVDRQAVEQEIAALQREIRERPLADVSLCDALEIRRALRRFADGDLGQPAIAQRAGLGLLPQLRGEITRALRTASRSPLSNR